MPSGEQEILFPQGTLGISLDASQKAQKANKFRGILCWGIFGAFLLFFIIMAAVYTEPKRYKAASPVDYLSGEDATLYKGLGIGPSAYNPTTLKMNALGEFQLGLQLLHLFWYDLAIAKFQRAQKLDSKLAMAYWGEAMCYKQPLWQSENITAAQAVLAQMDKAVNTSTLTDREQAYIKAAKQLFAANVTLQDRESLYATQMETIYEDFADDTDACAFAGLAKLGILSSVSNNLTMPRRGKLREEAIELLDDCRLDNPLHVGQLHYSVHLYDVRDLEQVQRGIAPALDLAKLAPSSNVAQHMRSHLFARLGNWSQVVVSNKDAVAASDTYCLATGGNNTCDADNRWHALEWQIYGQLQQCGVSAALTNYRRMQTVAASMNYGGSYGQWLYRTYAHLQLQSLNAIGAIPLLNTTDNVTAMLPPPLYEATSIQDAGDIEDHFYPPHAEANALLARVSALVWNRTAAQQSAPGVQTTVSTLLARLDAIVARQNNLIANSTNASATLNTDMTDLLITVQLQAKALVIASACAVNDTSRCGDWQSLMDQAMAKYNKMKDSTPLPTLKIAPTHEFYGNLLLATKGNTTLATAMFQMCVDEMPSRMTCVLGLARTASDSTVSRQWYNQLAAQCASGDKNFPALVEARKVLAAVPPPPPAKRGLLQRRAVREVDVAEAA